jgi:hypothetical protein
MPLAGLESVAQVRVMMALLWVRDSVECSDPEGLVEVDLGELRCASGYGDSGSYRQVYEGLSNLHRISFMTSDGEVFEVFDHVRVVENDEGKSCWFRVSPEFEALQQNLSDDGYGMVDMEEVVRLARGIDFSIYLRACSVRKRRKRVFEVSRAEMFCLSSRDPESPVGGAVRALKTSAGRVGSILKTKTTVEVLETMGKDRIKGLRVALEAL